MNETDFEESQAQRFATLSRWKRWLANVGILDGRVLLMSDAERQKMRTENSGDWLLGPYGRSGLRSQDLQRGRSRLRCIHIYSDA